MSEANPDPRSGAHDQAAEGRWYTYDRSPATPPAPQATASASPTGDLTSAGALHKAATSLHNLATVFVGLGWLAIALGVMAGLAIAGNEDPFTGESNLEAGLITGGVVAVSGLWLILLAKAAQVFARYTILRTADRT